MSTSKTYSKESSSPYFLISEWIQSDSSFMDDYAVFLKRWASETAV